MPPTSDAIPTPPDRARERRDTPGGSQCAVALSSSGSSSSDDPSVSVGNSAGTSSTPAEASSTLRLAGECTPLLMPRRVKADTMLSGGCCTLRGGDAIIRLSSCTPFEPPRSCGLAELSPSCAAPLVGAACGSPTAGSAASSTSEFRNGKATDLDLLRRPERSLTPSNAALRPFVALRPRASEASRKESPVSDGALPVTGSAEADADRGRRVVAATDAAPAGSSFSTTDLVAGEGFFGTGRGGSAARVGCCCAREDASVGPSPRAARGLPSFTACCGRVGTSTAERCWRLSLPVLSCGVVPPWGAIAREPASAAATARSDAEAICRDNSNENRMFHFRVCMTVVLRSAAQESRGARQSTRMQSAFSGARMPTQKHTLPQFSVGWSTYPH